MTDKNRQDPLERLSWHQVQWKERDGKYCNVTKLNSWNLTYFCTLQSRYGIDSKYPSGRFSSPNLHSRLVVAQRKLARYQRIAEEKGLLANKAGKLKSSDQNSLNLWTFTGPINE